MTRIVTWRRSIAVCCIALGLAAGATGAAPAPLRVQAWWLVARDDGRGVLHSGRVEGARLVSRWHVALDYWPEPRSVAPNGRFAVVYLPRQRSPGALTRLGSNGSRRLVAAVRRARSSPAISADGRRIAVGTTGPDCGDRRPGLALVGPRQRTTTLALPVAGIRRGVGVFPHPLAWSPDGRTIAVSLEQTMLSECGGRTFSSSRLLLVSTTTGHARRVRDVASTRSADWSHRGHFLAFAHGYNDECALETFAVASGRSRLVDSGDAYGGESPLDCAGEISYVWLPSGELAYARGQALWLFDPRTGARRELLSRQAPACWGCGARIVALTKAGRLIVALRTGRPDERWIAVELASRRISPLQRPRVPGRSGTWLRLVLPS